MASLYPKPRSPFWYVEYLDKDNVRRNESTKLRRDNGKETAQARELRARLEAAELARVVDDHARQSGGGWDFVPQYLIDDTRAQSPRTLERYQGAWHWISLFLAAKKLRHPRDIRFEHGQEFVSWRTGIVKRNTKKSVCHNTAVLDLRVFAKIMHRSVALRICVANPLVRMGIRREDSRDTPPITPAEMKIIEPALSLLEGDEVWMRISFHVARATGCRLRDTPLPRTEVDFDRRIIHFERPKGGKKKAFSVPLPYEIRGELEAAFADGRAVLFVFPSNPSLRWREFFDELGMPHLHFHSLRTTYVTKLALEGVPRAVAMRLVNHGSEIVHRIYQKLNVDDLRPYVQTEAPASSGQAAAGASL